MRSIIFVLSIVLPLMFFSTVVTAEETKKPCGDTSGENSQLNMVFNFMKENMIGKTFVSPEKTYKIDGGRMEALFAEEEKYSNLQMRKEPVSGGQMRQGFTYETTMNIYHKTYELDKDGKQIKETEKNLDRVRTQRCYVVEMFSTGGLLGYCQFLKDDGSIKLSPPPSEFELKLADSKLIRNSHEILYSDRASAESECGWKAGSSESLGEYYVLPDGKMEIKYTYNYFNVDPLTLKKTSSDTEPNTVIYKQN